MKRIDRRLLGALATAAALAGAPAAAQDLSLSAFGSLGYSVSDRDYHYQRFISRDGSANADSLLGAQADLRFSPQWSATAQLRLAPSIKSDSRWDLVPTWAFVAWRPSDDWLLRAGKMRLPLYLHSESMDVGNTHDMARLPVEMYGLVPSNDFVGLNVGKTWALGDKDLTLDAYSGSVDSTARFWMRDGAPPVFPQGANFFGVKVASSGAALALHSPDGTLRAGINRFRVKLANGQPIAASFPYVEIMPGVGYYQVSSSMPGPGVPENPAVRNMLYTLGVDQALAPDWRVSLEVARIVQYDTELGFDSHAGYVALFHTMGRFTPYLRWGKMKSSDRSLDWYERLAASQVPSYIPGAAELNAGQRTAAEFGYAVDQSSTALGSSFTIDANQRIKFEWQHTHVGRVSRFVDTPAGSDTINHTSIDTLSVGYHFSF